ncbi:MAG: MATE family efflux transporter [Ruminococcaceae bacterium]|nr:MATE family efflux transporter [Oscillospiraceae bacterium]
MDNKKYRKELFASALNMAIPAMVESFFVALAGLVDSYMVSTLGSSAVASVGLTTQPKFLGLAIFFAINVSLSALVARRYGERDRRGANGVLSTAIVLILILTAIITYITVRFASPILKFCGTTKETHNMAVTYYRIIMGGTIFTSLQMGINSAQRGAGNTRITMVTNITSNIVNVIFNYILINGKLGFPALGIRGAALATVLGNVVAMIMSIISVSKKDCFVSVVYIIKEKVRPGIIYLKNIIRVGYSVFFEQMLMRLGFMATALMAANQGNYAMAAHQVGMNIMGLSFSFGDGLQHAAVALIGRSLGEGDKEKAKDYGATCQRIGGVISVVLSFVYFFGARWLMNLFFEEEEIVRLGVSIMYTIIITVLFQIRQIVYTGSLRGAGDTFYTAVSAAVSVTVTRTVFSYLFAYVFKWGIVGVWMGVIADQMTRFILCGLRFKKGDWVNIKI